MIALRLVLDTNVIVSAAMRPRGLENTALTKPAMLFVSEAILDEYAAVLRRPELLIPRGDRLRLMEISFAKQMRHA